MEERHKEMETFPPIGYESIMQSAQYEKLSLKSLKKGNTLYSPEMSSSCYDIGGLRGAVWMQKASLKPAFLPEEGLCGVCSMGFRKLSPQTRLFPCNWVITHPWHSLPSVLSSLSTLAKHSL